MKMCLVGVRAKDQSVKCQNFEGFQKSGGSTSDIPEKKR